MLAYRCLAGCCCRPHCLPRLVAAGDGRRLLHPTDLLRPPSQKCVFLPPVCSCHLPQEMYLGSATLLYAAYLCALHCAHLHVNQTAQRLAAVCYIVCRHCRRHECVSHLPPLCWLGFSACKGAASRCSQLIHQPSLPLLGGGQAPPAPAVHRHHLPALVAQQAVASCGAAQWPVPAAHLVGCGAGVAAHWGSVLASRQHAVQCTSCARHQAESCHGGLALCIHTARPALSDAYVQAPALIQQAPGFAARHAAAPHVQHL